MKKILLLSTAVLFAVAVTAQTKLGTNPGTVNAATLLELESSTKGMLPVRMTYVQMNAIASPPEGLQLYCTDCSPKGPYYFNGTSWVTFGSANIPNATFTSATIACGGTLAGTYQQGTASNSANTKTVTITSSTGGAYIASTNLVNGIQFLGTGTIYTTGAGTPILLTATGTPTAAGSFIYTATVGGQTCTFSVTFAPAATFNCAGAIQTQTPQGALMNGVSYTGSYTIPYTAGNGSSYGATSQTINGLTLTRTAGTYLAGGGNIVYNLSGTQIGTNVIVTFPIPECGNVLFGDAIRGALAAGGCTSCIAYDAAAVNDWIAITAAEYTAVANVSNIAGVGKYAVADAQMAAGGPVGFAPAGYAFQGAQNTGDPMMGAKYAVAFSLRPTANTVSVTNISGAKVKFGATNTSGYIQYGSILPTFSGPGTTTLFFVIKRPTVIAPGVGSLGYMLGTGGTGQTPGEISSTTTYYDSGDISSMGSVSSYKILMQCVGTATKQW